MIKRGVHALVVGLMLVGTSQLSVASMIDLVTGSGVHNDNFRATVTAHRDSTGRVGGSVAVEFDLSEFDLGHVAAFGPVTCLEVDGPSAWIGLVVTQSTNEDLIPVGIDAFVLVRDLGGEGEDIVHTAGADAYPPGTTCADRPGGEALPDTVATSGNFHVVHREP